MGILDLFRKRETPETDLPPEGSGVLTLLFGSSPELLNQLNEDVSIYRETGLEIAPHKTDAVQEVQRIISSARPGILHLLASFTDRGSLVDASGGELFLKELMRLSEDSGVRLFIIASQNHFDNIKGQIAKTMAMNFLTLMNRNRHFGTFLRGIITGLSKDPNFALAYVKLAPQSQRAQQGLPLPGSIAICPAKKGKNLVLWSEAQP
ncbi:MAG: hypothetical protein ACJ74W_02395 [Pyrinomonadaceae bacterium]